MLSAIQSGHAGVRTAGREAAFAIAVDRLVVIASYWYLVIPSLIFVAGWLRWYYALPAACLLLVSCLLCCREESWQPSVPLLSDRPQKKAMGVSLVMLTLWFTLSGIGGYTFQNSDFLVRNAMLRDLVFCHWPIVETTAGGSHQIALVYYIGHFLPAALIGKVLGLGYAQHALFLWSLLGGAATLYLFFRHIGKVSWFYAFIFMAFSGLDVVGHILLKGHIPMFGRQVEWWATYFQYTSLTAGLYWAFNQFIGPWVAVMLLLNQKTGKNVLFILAAMLIQAPFPSIGLLVLVWFVPNATGTPGILSRVRKRLSLQGVVPLLTLAIICGLYYSSCSGSGCTFREWYFCRCHPLSKACGLLCLFWLLEFALLMAAIAPAYRRDTLFWVNGLALALIPLYRIGYYNDFVMRVSIPSLAILSAYVVQYIDAFPQRSSRRTALMVMLFLGFWTSGSEVARSLYHANQWPHICDGLHCMGDTRARSSLISHHRRMRQYVAHDADASLFFRELARK